MTVEHRERHARPALPPVLRTLSLAIGLTFGLGACGGGGGDGNGEEAANDRGDVGAQLRGTVPDNRRLASRELEIRATSGERSRTTIGPDGRFRASELPGTGPYLMRASFGDGEAWYGIAEPEVAETANVHAYTDLAVRNHLAAKGVSIDEVFEADGAVPAASMPDVDQVAAADRAIESILAPALEAYGLAGTNLAKTDFSADGGSVDDFLEKNPLIVEDDTFTILSTDPVTDTRTTVSDKVSLTRDLVAGDTVAPGPPGTPRALSAASDEIVIVWTPAKDDVAVTRYEVRRDGAAIATTPFPVYADVPLAGGVDYTYTVVAIDEAGNRSEETPTSVGRPLAVPDTTPPPAPTGVQVVVTNASARVSWIQDGITDVAAFRILRSSGDGELADIVRSTSTGLIDVDLMAATDYCYRIIAVDAYENASPPSAIECARTNGTGELTAAPEPIEPAGSGQTLYLDARNITVAEGENSTPSLNNTVSLNNVIDAESADALESHDQTTHVWHTGERLELLFDFQREYSVLSVHFWNYFGETYDVDTLDLTFQDASGAETGFVALMPAIGMGDPVGAEDIALDEAIVARFVIAVLRGTNSQSDFQNLGFTVEAP